MRSVLSSRLVLAAGLAAFGALPAASAATSDGEPQPAAAALADTQRILGDSADVMLHYIQEDGPASGHVRVELTPETRPLTLIEARMAAEKAFLAALDEPGLGGDLQKITVVVRLMPASFADPESKQQVIIYLHKGGQDWSVLSGE